MAENRHAKCVCVLCMHEIHIVIARSRIACRKIYTTFRITSVPDGYWIFGSRFGEYVQPKFVSASITAHYARFISRRQCMPNEYCELLNGLPVISSPHRYSPGTRHICYISSVSSILVESTLGKNVQCTCLPLPRPSPLPRRCCCSNLKSIKIDENQFVHQGTKLAIQFDRSCPCAVCTWVCGGMRECVCVLLLILIRVYGVRWAHGSKQNNESIMLVHCAAAVAADITFEFIQIFRFNYRWLWCDKITIIRKRRKKNWTKLVWPLSRSMQAKLKK